MDVKFPVTHHVGKPCANTIKEATDMSQEPTVTVMKMRRGLPHSGIWFLPRLKFPVLA